MRMVRRSFGFAGSQLRGTHLVEQQERVNVVEVGCWERTVNQKAGPFESLDGRDDVANRSQSHTVVPARVRPTGPKGFQTDKISKAACRPPASARDASHSERRTTMKSSLRLSGKWLALVLGGLAFARVGLAQILPRATPAPSSSSSESAADPYGRESPYRSFLGFLRALRARPHEVAPRYLPLPQGRRGGP